MSRRAAVRRVGLLVLGANLALAVGKGIVWFDSGSLAIGSEAVNSVADTAYSLVILAGLYLTTRPPDTDHPHGHERIEPFVGLFVALAIFAAGGVVLWQAAASVIYGRTPAVIGPAAIGVLLASAAVKYWLYRYSLRVGEAERSPAAIATALDNRNDILTAGAALVGVLGARFGVPVLDPLAAAVVSIGIFHVGLEVLRDNVNYLVGRAPPEWLLEEIVRRATAHPEARGVHDVIAHHVGPEVDVSLHVEVEGDRTLIEVHEIETTVAESIRELPDVDDVFVHVDPRELGEWKHDADVDRLLRAGRSDAGPSDE